MTLKERVEPVAPGIQKRQQIRSDGSLGPVTYRARYRDPYGRQRTKTFIRLGEAKRFRHSVLVDKDRGEYIDTTQRKRPYGPWALVWLEGLGKPGDGRMKNLVSIMNVHILPTFGTVPFGAIDEALLRQWAGDVAQGRTSPDGRPPGGWHLSHIRGLLVRSLQAAAGARLVSPLVPALAKQVIDFATPTRKPERFLNHAEAEYFISGSTNGVEHIDPAWRPFHYASVWTGCGWEELAGLLRENLDLDGGCLHVKTVAVKSGGRYVLKNDPKNEYRIRSVDLTPHLIKALRVHLIAAPPSQLVFPNSDGGVLHYSNFNHRTFAPAVERCNLERFTFHDLRHTHCAWLIDQDWTEFQIVRRMGWSDGRMLHKTYGHLLKRRNREAMEGLEKAWSEAKAAAISLGV